MSSFPSQKWERELVDGLIDAGNDNAELSGEGAREKAMENLAEPIAKAIKNGGGGVHWIDSFTVAEINAMENPEKDGIYGVKDSGVIVNRDGSRIEVSANDAIVWNGEKWASFIDIDLEGYAKKEDVAAAVASAVASEATLRVAGDDNNAKAIRANAESIERHIADKTNPHGVTAGQVGAYTKSETDTRIAEATRDIGGKKIVTELPPLQEADKRITYLLVTDESGVYKQYCTNDTKTDWIYLGDTQVDLSDYETKADAKAKANTYGVDLSSTRMSSGTYRINITRPNLS